MSPPVAATESANPHDDAIGGEATTRTTTAKARACTPARRVPVMTASSATTAITDARSTLGCGPTMTTKAPRAAPATATRAMSPSPASVARNRTTPTTMEVLPPDTAVRCDRPATLIWSASAGGCAVSSPTARPSTSAAASDGAPSRDARKAPRTEWASPPSGPGESITLTRSASMRAAMPRRGSPSRRLPVTLTRAPMGGASAGSMRIITGAPSSHVPAAMLTDSACARTSRVGSPKLVRIRMSPMTVASTVARAPTA